jgi:hypothetical protein
MTVRNPECRVQVHASRMSARKGTHSQVRALALRDTAQPTMTTGSGPEVMPGG